MLQQAALSAPLRRASLGVWEALDLLGTLREYETALLEEEGLDPTLALPEHAAATAEACRAAFPDLDWLHLVGLLHSLGKLLAHKRCAAPQAPTTLFACNWRLPADAQSLLPKRKCQFAGPLLWSLLCNSCIEAGHKVWAVFSNCVKVAI